MAYKFNGVIDTPGQAISNRTINGATSDELSEWHRGVFEQLGMDFNSQVVARDIVMDPTTATGTIRIKETNVQIGTFYWEAV